MKKTTLFTALVLVVALNTTAQNTWDGSSISTITTNGKVAIGTATPDAQYRLTVRNTNNSIQSGIWNNIQNTNTNVQYGISNGLTYNGTSGRKFGIWNSLMSGSSDDNYGIYSFVLGGAYGNRFGIVTALNSGNKTECGVYSEIGASFGGYPYLPSGDRSGYFIGTLETVAKTDLEKAFIVTNRNFSQAGFGTEVFRVYGDGTVFATEVNVMLASNFPDYVFSPTYNLMSIYDLRNYISENKHLPNVPPASEVEQSGLNLGEMNVKLVEKVEELTLYIIQQQEQIDALKKEVENLKH